MNPSRTRAAPRSSRLQPLALFALLAALLSACGTLTGPRQDFAIFELDPAVSHSQAPGVSWQLVIEPPLAIDLIDSHRIVVAPGDNERRVYAGARWAERAPILLQNLWLRAYEVDGRLAGVARSGSGVRSDLILATDLTRFHARYIDGEPVVEVEFHARLIDPRDRRIKARRTFSADVPASGTAIAEVVAAFDQAVARINPELVEWTLADGSRGLVRAEPHPETETRPTDDR